MDYRPFQCHYSRGDSGLKVLKVQRVNLDMSSLRTIDRLSKIHALCELCRNRTLPELIQLDKIGIIAYDRRGSITLLQSSRIARASGAVLGRLSSLSSLALEGKTTGFTITGLACLS